MKTQTPRFVLFFVVLGLAVLCRAADPGDPAPTEILLRTPINVIEPNAGPGGINVEAEKWGFIDGTGKLVIPAVWACVADFHEGLARVKKGDKAGFIDQNGKVVIEPKWDLGSVDIAGQFIDTYHGGFYDGLAQVELGRKRGFIDKSGKVVIPLQFEFASDFSEGMAVVEQKDKWSFINTSGKVVIPPSADWDQAFPFYKSIANVEKRGPSEEGMIGDLRFKGYIDRTGKLLGSCQWDWAGHFSEGLARVFKGVLSVGNESGGKTYFLNEAGKIVLEPKCVYADDFHEGLAGIQPDKTSGWGFMDRSGKIVIPPRWEEIKPFFCGLAAVVDDHKQTGFIDKTGKVVIEPKWCGAYAFEDGICCVQQQTDHGISYGVIDMTGRVLIQPEWDKMEIERGGYCFATRVTDPTKGERYAWFNKTGKMIWHSDL